MTLEFKSQINILFNFACLWIMYGMSYPGTCFFSPLNMLVSIIHIDMWLWFMWSRCCVVFQHMGTFSFCLSVPLPDNASDTLSGSPILSSVLYPLHWVCSFNDYFQFLEILFGSLPNTPDFLCVNRIWTKSWKQYLQSSALHPVAAAHLFQSTSWNG